MAGKSRRKKKGILSPPSPPPFPLLPAYFPAVSHLIAANIASMVA